MVGDPCFVHGTSTINGFNHRNTGKDSFGNTSATILRNTVRSRDDRFFFICTVPLTKPKPESFGSTLNANNNSFGNTPPGMAGRFRPA